MNKSLNTFVVVLLAFPFYLAQKGRLSAYVDLAKPAKASATASASAPSTSAATSPASASGATSQGAAQSLSTAASAYTPFADAAALFA